MHILLVEDNPCIQETLKLFLEMDLPVSNLAIDTASTCEEAIEALKKKRPHLVLLDLSLSDCQGFDAYKKIRALSNFKSLPIIAVTAHNYPCLQSEAMKLGFYGYITKPIDFQNSLNPLVIKLAQQENISLKGCTLHV